MRRLLVAEEKFAQEGDSESRIRRMSAGDVFYLPTWVEGLELEKAAHDATVAKVKGEFLGLARFVTRALVLRLLL